MLKRITTLTPKQNVAHAYKPSTWNHLPKSITNLTGTMAKAINKQYESRHESRTMPRGMDLLPKRVSKPTDTIAKAVNIATDFAFSRSKGEWGKKIWEPSSNYYLDKLKPYSETLNKFWPFSDNTDNIDSWVNNQYLTWKNNLSKEQKIIHQDDIKNFEDAIKAYYENPNDENINYNLLQQTKKIVSLINRNPNVTTNDLLSQAASLEFKPLKTTKDLLKPEPTQPTKASFITPEEERYKNQQPSLITATQPRKYYNISEHSNIPITSSNETNTPSQKTKKERLAKLFESNN